MDRKPHEISLNLIYPLLFLYNAICAHENILFPFPRAEALFLINTGVIIPATDADEGAHGIPFDTPHWFVDEDLGLELPFLTALCALPHFDSGVFTARGHSGMSDPDAGGSKRHVSHPLVVRADYK